jgi:hypothetical protein
MNKIYNEDIKMKFLNDKYDSEDTRNVMKYIFYYSFGEELPRNKDLYDFNLDEIIKVITNSRPKSLSVAITRVRYISQYIAWAISPEINLRRDNLNPLLNFDEGWFKECVRTDVKQFISKTELDEIIGHLENYQDKVVLQLLFEGIYGRESTELRNLKRTDIKGNIVTVYDDYKEEPRQVELSDEAIKIIEKADEETIYKLKNGLSDARSNEAEILDTEYVIKNTSRGRSQAERTKQNIILNRIRMVSELFDLPDLTPKSINRSGMIYMGYQLFKEKGKLEYEDFEKIGDHYGINKINNNGHILYNTTYLRGFINEENIRELYDL